MEVFLFYKKVQSFMSRVKGSISPFSSQDVRDKAAQTNIEKYGVDNPFKSKEIREKIAKTNIERYGVDNPFKSQKFQELCRKKFKETINKRKQKQYDELEFIVPDWDSIKGTRTMSESGIRLHYPKFYEYIIEHYPQDIQFKEKLWLYRNGLNEPPVCKVCGLPVKFTSNDKYSTYCSSKCANNDPDKIDKTKQNNLKKYGVESVSQLPEIREKVSNTNLRRYGCIGPSSKEEIKQRIKEHNREKYGVDWPSQLEEVKKKRKNTNRSKYGVDYSIQLPSAKLTSNNSTPNKRFAKLLDEYNIPYEREYHIEQYSYDFKVGNILIEINPTITHNIQFNPWSEPKTKAYHSDKSKMAKQYGFRCIHIWDWDDPIKIINLLIPTEKVGARKCKCKEIQKNVALDFLQQYHLQGGVKGISVSIGLYNKDELIGVMCFGKPRYAMNFEYELLRLCFKSGVSVIGGSEKMFNYFIEKYHPESVISYCDTSKFNGIVYDEIGFKKESTTISGHWYNPKTKRHITDNMLRSRGFDQLFNEHYGKGTSNEELIIQAGFFEVFDCGQSRYVWYK